MAISELATTTVVQATAVLWLECNGKRGSAKMLSMPTLFSFTLVTFWMLVPEYFYTVSPFGSPSCPSLTTPLSAVTTSGRKWEEGRQTDSVRLLLWIYWGMVAGVWGIMGSAGWWGRVTCSPACSPPLLAAWLMVRARKSAGGSAVLRSRRGGNTKKTRWELCLEEKYDPLSLFYCAGRDQAALCYDWALWGILSRGQQQRGDDSSWERGSEVMWRSISETVRRTQAEC